VNVGLADATTGFEINVTPVERILRRTALVAAGEYRCPVDHPQFIGGGPETCPFIVFPRSSVHMIPDRGQAEACTPNTVNLLDVGDCYSRRPISPEGAACDWIAAAPQVLREMMQALRPAYKGKSQPLFDRAVVPVAAPTFVAQRTFFCAVRNGSAIPPLAFEETVFRLLERVLRETRAFMNHAASAAGPRHTAASRQREMVEHTKYILAREFPLPLSIAHLAQRVHCSAWHLARSFRKMTGSTLHNYQQQLRLRAALDLLAESDLNGTAIASRLGFASHSHFSNVFHRQFGLTPRAFARACSRASLGYMQATLQAQPGPGQGTRS